MAIYEINDQIRNNIFAFLDRVDLKGSEAEALIAIKYVLSNPKKEFEEESGK